MKPAQRQGGRGKCSVCAHADRDEIDNTLVAGGSLDSIAARYGLSRSSLRRHKLNHPRRDLMKVDGPAEVNASRPAGLPIDVPAELQAQFERTLANVHAAARTRSHQAIDSANREHRLTMALLADWNNERDKLEILARPAGGAVNVLASKQWQTARWIVLDVLTPYPHLREAISRRLRELGDSIPTEVPNV